MFFKRSDLNHLQPKRLITLSLTFTRSRKFYSVICSVMGSGLLGHLLGQPQIYSVKYSVITNLLGHLLGHASGEHSPTS